MTQTDAPRCTCQRVRIDHPPSSKRVQASRLIEVRIVPSGRHPCPACRPTDTRASASRSP